jgi:hypothetical protein
MTTTICEAIGSTCRHLTHLGVAGEPCPVCGAQEALDHLQALGVSCRTCGHYWVPSTVPADLRSGAEAWELRSTADREEDARPPATMLTALRRRLREEVKHG